LAPTHAHETFFVISSNNAPNALSTPIASYDEQLGLMLEQRFTNLSYNITAVPQNNSYGCGPAYLLSGLSMMGIGIK
jgi:hypothetical protein